MQNALTVGSNIKEFWANGEAVSPRLYFHFIWTLYLLNARTRVDDDAGDVAANANAPGAWRS